MDGHLGPPRRRPCRATTRCSGVRKPSTGRHTNAYGNQTYPGNGAAHQGYGQAPGYDQPQYAAPTTTGRPMTIDSVVQKTGIALAVVIVFATLTWWYIGDIRT